MFYVIFVAREWRQVTFNYVVASEWQQFANALNKDSLFYLSKSSSSCLIFMKTFCDVRYIQIFLLQESRLHYKTIQFREKACFQNYTPKHLYKNILS